MDQPVTRAEFERLEKEQKQLKEEMRQLKEQRTEEIKAVRVEVASEDVLNQLKALEQGQQKLLKEMNEKFEQIIQPQTDHSGKLNTLQEDVGVLKVEMAGARADILQTRESQADLRDRIIEHGEHFKAIEDKQESHTEILGNLLNFAESHGTLLKNTATKEDIAPMATKEDLTAVATKEDITALKGDMGAMETRLIETMKQLLQEKG
ncbi:MAG TPA: hypothetical protein VN207_11715 [Ktedonobacteraceae bacterium]|nr:hypothetical protein [Ktedonobacteraceae bacterium]